MLSFLLALPLLIFHGNVALVEDVYRTALDLPAGTKATPASGREDGTRSGASPPARRYCCGRTCLRTFLMKVRVHRPCVLS